MNATRLNHVLLLAGTGRAEYPDLSLGQGTFSKAMVEDVSGEQERMF